MDNEHFYIWSSSIKQPLPGWQTEAQIAALHSSERVAKGIVANKEAEGLVDKHPDDPTLTTYYVPCHLVFVDAFSKCMEAMKEIWKNTMSSGILLWYWTSLILTSLNDSLTSFPFPSSTQVCTELGRKDEEETEDALSLGFKAKINPAGEASRQGWLGHFTFETASMVSSNLIQIQRHAVYSIYSGFSNVKALCFLQGASKLMDGLKGDELDGFIKLRAYQKQEKQANASTTTVLQGASEPKRRKTAKPTFDGIGFDRFFLVCLKSSKVFATRVFWQWKRQHPRKEMPSDPVEGLEWVVPVLLRELTEAKMLPIKMASLKHQDKLRILEAYMVVLLDLNHSKAHKWSRSFLMPLLLRWHLAEANGRAGAVLLWS